MTDLELRQEQIRKLSFRIGENVRRYLYDNNQLETWKTTDPEKVDEFWKLQEWLDHACKLYLDDKIPWDRDIREDIEVIQTDPESTPVSVKVKRYDFRPSVMQAARDLFVFVVLP